MSEFVVSFSFVFPSTTPKSDGYHSMLPLGKTIKHSHEEKFERKLFLRMCISKEYNCCVGVLLSTTEEIKTVLRAVRQNQL